MTPFHKTDLPLAMYAALALESLTQLLAKYLEQICTQSNLYFPVPLHLAISPMLRINLHQNPNV